MRGEKGTTKGTGYKRVVARFDAHLDAVAPHVAARLSPEERRELERWLDDRAAVQSRPGDTTLLESLPALLARAEAAIANGASIDDRLHERLTRALGALLDVLERTAADANAGGELSGLDDRAALKERLDIIRKHVF